jgi:hypothetical protein
MPKDAKPLSNAEVNQIIKQHYARKAAEDPQSSVYTLATEQGNELRKATVGYLEIFNEFELNEQILDIRT